MQSDLMQSEVFLRSDIRNMLRAIEFTNSALSTYVSTPEAGAYRAGFVAALQAVAAAFDINTTSCPESPSTRLRLADPTLLE